MYFNLISLSLHYYQLNITIKMQMKIKMRIRNCRLATVNTLWFKNTVTVTAMKLLNTNLEIVWQFGAASISWIHCNENGTCRIQLYFCSLKYEFLDTWADCPLNGQYLVCHHRQHLKLNTVELIKTQPGPTWGQSLKKYIERTNVEVNFEANIFRM